MKALQQKDQSKFREQVALWLVSLGGMLYNNDPVKNTEIQVFMQLEYMNAVALNYAEPTVPAAGLA